MNAVNLVMMVVYILMWLDYLMELGTNNVNDEEGEIPEFDNKNSLKIPKLNNYVGFLNDYPCMSP